MEKALKALKAFLERETVEGGTPYSEFFYDEAIAELEAMKQRTCDGCRHGMYGVDSLGIEVECGIGFRCTRGQKDRYEPKDNA